MVKWFQEQGTPLVLDMLAANLPVFSLFAGGNMPHTMQWTLKMAGHPVSAALTVRPDNGKRALAAMSERKLWLLGLNKCVRGGSWTNALDVTQPVETVTLDLDELGSIYPEFLPTPLRYGPTQLRENHHLRALQAVLDSIYTMLTTLANTRITITDLNGGFAPVSFPLLENFHAALDSQAPVGAAVYTLTFPQWVLGELSHGCLYASSQYFNIGSLLGMRLYELAAGLNLTDTNPSADIPFSLICDRTACYHDTAHLLKRLQTCVKHDDLPDYTLSFDRNSQVLRISRRKNQAA